MRKEILFKKGIITALTVAMVTSRRLRSGQVA